MSQDNRTFRYLAPVLLFTLLFTLLFPLCSCGEGAPPELEEAARVVHYMVAPRNLSRSMFSAAFPDQKPSQFVSYLFSSMGRAEWPTPATDFEREQLKSIGAPATPQDVAFVSRTLDPKKGKQLVVKFDDRRSVVIVEGYVDPDEPPVLTREWALKRVSPAPGVMEIYRSNAELGMSDHSF